MFVSGETLFRKKSWKWKLLCTIARSCTIYEAEVIKRFGNVESAITSMQLLSSTSAHTSGDYIEKKSETHN